MGFRVQGGGVNMGMILGACRVITIGIHSSTPPSAPVRSRDM